tara:strand:+ start:1808 stop:1924 length:117 start_codon:yes stop_codon:yes gene_type:complete
MNIQVNKYKIAVFAIVLAIVWAVGFLFRQIYYFFKIFL